MGLMTMNDPLTFNNASNDEILHVIYDYTSREDDELTLKRGSIVEVLSKDEKISGSEGWWTGRLVDSESVGIFPANFVASSEPILSIIDYKDLQIGDLIGVGGFGHVHCGKFGDVDVAIKSAKSLTTFSNLETPSSSKSQDDETYKSLINGLLREARLFSILTHRNIIQLFGVSPSPQTRNLYLVMEYARGGALNCLLQQRKSGLYPHVFVQYARQITAGMRYLHDEASEHIIHRDLKCSNVLILEDIADVFDENDLVTKTLKITDFGLAKKQVQSSSTSTAGTFAWMSPECIRSNEFSVKSDVWSFGVLLWECLTGEIPYKGFDQMQVAFGIATNKYSLPIPSTCPEEFSKLMKDCWQFLPQDRPTFSQLHEQINQIIESYSNDLQLYQDQVNEEAYSSLQEDWRKEIQDIFEELKTKEQEIRDREQAMLQLTLQQNDQRMQLEQWEHDLHERELLVIERELKLLMLNGNSHQERTPKIQKRSGHFMRALLSATLNGTSSLSATTSSHVISHPMNFRHLISVSRENNMLQQHHHPSLDFGTASSTLPNAAKTPSPQKSVSTSSTLPTNSTLHSPPPVSKSTPTTPNLNRLRTLTSSGDLIINKLDDEEPLMFNEVHFADEEQESPSEQSPRSSTNSPSKSAFQRTPWRKSKLWTQSTATKRKHPKPKVRHGEAKWYLETISSISSNTPSPTTTNEKTVSESSDEISSSSSSTCSTPNNDHSIARAIFDMNSVFLSIALGRRVPAQNPPPTPSSTSSSTTATPKASVQSEILRSSSEIHQQTRQSPSSSVNTTPSPLTKRQHKRTCSSPTTHHNAASPNNNFRARPRYSPVRPSSLVLSSIPFPASSAITTTASHIPHNSQSDPQLIHRHYSQSSQSTTITSTPEEMEQTSDDDYERFYSAQSSKISTPMVQPLTASSHISNSQPQLYHSHILDIETDEQKKHQTRVLPPEVDRKKVYISQEALERDFLS